MHRLLEDSDLSYAYGNYVLNKNRVDTGEFDEDRLKQCNFVSTNSLIRSKDFIGFNEDLERHQDWDLWLRMLKEGKKGIYKS